MAAVAPPLVASPVPGTPPLPIPPSPAPGSSSKKASGGKRTGRGASRRGSGSSEYSNRVTYVEHLNRLEVERGIQVRNIGVQRGRGALTLAILVGHRLARCSQAPCV